MAIINDPNITSQLQDLAGGGVIDSNDVVALLNAALPAGQQLQAGVGIASGIYKPFGTFDKVNAKIEVVTTGLWTGDAGSLTTFFTSSTQVGNSGDYYYNVYSTNPLTDSSAEAQYAVAYGHVNGSGSVSLSNSDDALLASKATYAQYKSVLLEPTDTKFSFENGSGVANDSNDIYAINLNRARYREKMDAGNWKLTVSGSNGVFHFIDDSGKKFGDTLGKAGRVFKVVSGSLNLGTENEATIKTTVASNDEGYGLFYPDRGIIVLNPTAIADTIGDVSPWGGALESASGSLSVSAEQQNHKLLVQAIENGGDFEARRTENVSTQHFFVRATNREFNYSNNPTYVNASGTFVESSFETDPKTFITTVGLYNDSNELIAVAKTSQPIEKSFDREVLIKVKLSF
tara:strand:- start:1311 stop:2516 length:1206 start_codon:yes stop_codon:yes gene_type:complete